MRSVVPILPTTTSPVATPIRVTSARSAPWARSAARRSWHVIAARTARIAWSGRSLGAFQKAMTPSPMNLSTVPPEAPMTVAISPR